MMLFLGIIIGIFLAAYLGIGLILWFVRIGLHEPNPLIIIGWPITMIRIALSVDNDLKLHTTAGTYKPLDPNYAASGEQRITIQYKFGLTGDRRERREELIRKFKKISDILEMFHCRVNWGTISVSGQTVEAVLPLYLLDTLKEKLDGGPYRFDELVERQVADG